MRYWLLPIVAALIMVPSAGAQTKKDPKKETSEPTAPEITEVQGKSFLQWKKQITTDDPAEREVAFRAVIHFPTDKAYAALPDILKQLERDKFEAVDLSVCVNGVIAVGKIIQAKRTPTTEMIELMKEVQAMTASIAKEGKTKKNLAELQAKQKALIVLGEKSGPDPKLVDRALAIFRRFLKKDQIILKVRAVQALPYLGPKARQALLEVKLVCNDHSSWEVRNEGLTCMMQLCFTEKGELDKELIKEFLKRLPEGSLRAGDNSALVRSTAITALGQLGRMLPKDDEIDRARIIAKLNGPAEKDPDHRVRITAHVSIMTIQQKPSKLHMEAIQKYLNDIDPRVRLAAVTGLLMPGMAAKKVLPSLAMTLHKTVADDPHPEVAGAALVGLVQLHEFEQIKDLLENREPYVRLAAVHGLVARGDEIKKTIPTIHNILLLRVEDRAPEVAYAALGGLVALKAYDTAAALEALQKRFEKTKPLLSQQIDATITALRLNAQHEKTIKDNDKKGAK